MLIDLEEAENELRHAIVVECRQDVQATLRQRTDFCNMLTSMEDFLIKGVTTAVLNDAGTVPFLRDVLHRSVSAPALSVFLITVCAVAPALC